MKKVKSNYRIVVINYENTIKKALARRVKVSAAPNNLFFVHKYNGKFRISEALSGSCACSEGNSVKDMIETLNKNIENINRAKYKTFDDFIQDHLKQFNKQPLLCNLKVFED